MFHGIKWVDCLWWSNRFPINSHYSNPNIWKGIVEFYNQETDTMMTLRWASSSIIVSHFMTGPITLVKRYADLKFPLNNASLSHDGQTMVVSGDSNKFAVYNQNELTNQFLLTLR
ncbi:CRL_G0038530.mRNA.1.CDS.1 [Saccharomyces cerevisiae]|nr:CRL_G0038530.mRNA.1.CDS.1 [Saccharomyces cerevisiae]CAI7415025.1 CRL_G0038530.mRNA.1.CDS.1 [Saccharomyces cerevisiae]